MKFIEDASDEKLRGGFYTPEAIARFILKWAVNGNKNYDILEPSCGDGVFLEQIKKNKFEYKAITAIELDPAEAKKSEKIGLKNSKILNRDFFSYCNSTNNKFDLVIGNPPYIRYQYFDKKQRIEAEGIFKKANLKYSKLTNAWVSFVVGSSLLLKEKGKMAFVLPAEILQVSYAKPLREFLSHFYNKISLVSFKKLVFPKIQQEVVLLLCEKVPGSKDHLIEHIEVKDAKDLEKLDISALKAPKKKIDFQNNKWTFYFLSQKEIDFLEKMLHSSKLKPLGHFAKVEVGITTGSNEFFTVPEEIVKNYALEKYARPLVGRSVQVSGNKFNKEDWKDNVKRGARAFFLIFPNKKDLISNKKALEYLNFGEQKGINKWYKCSIRDEWQMVPSARISEALFIRRNNLFPKLIINTAKAYTTDTMHRVSVIDKDKTDMDSLIASYYNSLSFALAELFGRSHGGGVLELMPSEAENILIPYSPKNGKMLNKIDSMLRNKEDTGKILDFTDNKILKENFGLSDKEVALARGIWKKLMGRRRNRTRSI